MAERPGEPGVQPIVPPQPKPDDYFVTRDTRFAAPATSTNHQASGPPPITWPLATPTSPTPAPPTPTPTPPAPPAAPRRRAAVPTWVVVVSVLAVAAAVVVVRAKQSGGAVVGLGDGSFGAVTARPPVRDVIDPTRILPKPSPVGGSGGYTVLAERGGAPVTWDPCEPIHFVVRPDNQIPGGRVALDQAIDEISKETGLYFVDDGATTEAPSESRSAYQPDRYGQNWAPVLITWSDESEYPGLAGDVVGLAGPISVGGKDARIVTGEVVFDAADLTKIEAGPDGMTYVHDVLLHELGHLVGLGHINEPSSIMNPVTQLPLAGYSAGDRRGLAALGSGHCFTKY